MSETTNTPENVLSDKPLGLFDEPCKTAPSFNLPDISKPNELVKDLEYFLDEIAKEKGYKSYDEIIIECTHNDKYMSLKWSIDLTAERRFNEYLIKSKDHYKDTLIDQILKDGEEIKELRATIEEQRKEITKLKQEKISEYWRGWNDFGASL